MATELKRRKDEELAEFAMRLIKAEIVERCATAAEDLIETPSLRPDDYERGYHQACNDLAVLIREFIEE